MCLNSYFESPRLLTVHDPIDGITSSRSFCFSRWYYSVASWSRWCTVNLVNLGSRIHKLFQGTTYNIVHIDMYDHPENLQDHPENLQSGHILLWPEVSQLMMFHRILFNQRHSVVQTVVQSRCGTDRGNHGVVQTVVQSRCGTDHVQCCLWFYNIHGVNITLVHVCRCHLWSCSNPASTSFCIFFLLSKSASWRNLCLNNLIMVL